MKDLTKAAAGLTLAAALAAGPARAETQTEHVVAEQRVSVSVRVSPEAAQAFMPKGWVPNASAAGPTLSLIFMDRALALTPEGKPLQSGVNRLLVLSMAGKNLATGEVRGLIVGGYSADPLGTPGAYKVYGPGVVGVTRTEHSQVKAGRIETDVDEHWSAQGADGATVELTLSYVRGLPTFSAFEQKIYSGADPDFYRIYRGQQASDVLRGPGGVDQVRAVSLKASGGKLGKALEGTPQILSITAAPFYSRKTYLP